MEVFNSGAIEWLDKRSLQLAILSHKIDFVLKSICRFISCGFVL